MNATSFVFPALPSVSRMRGARILVRVDFNVPMQEGIITDTFRIAKTMPLIKILLTQGAHVTLLSHLTETKKHRSFKPLVRGLEHACGTNIKLARSVAEAGAFDAQRHDPHTVILLENLRAFPGEEQNSPLFARELALLGDIYINEDFSQSHRAYASMVTLPALLPSYAGPLFRTEVRMLEKAFTPPHPFVLILGGRKFATKVGVLKQFFRKADTIFIGGAIANTFLSAAGYSIGRSPVEESARSSIRRTFLKHPALLLPVDVRVPKGMVRAVSAVGARDHIYDAGPDTIRMLAESVKNAKLVLWNGPLGYIEGGYETSTVELLRILSRSRAKVIIGGGDTMAVIDKHNMGHAFYHLSTGGGAMLEFLANGTLPGIEALMRKA